MCVGKCKKMYNQIEFYSKINTPCYIYSNKLLYTHIMYEAVLDISQESSITILYITNTILYL
ncbi:MAG: hypothetical protein ACD_80C00102G0011 [uncultured bacterium (gcode 4)]|uniref:Uncharacterized protein n=1 Tax=uncultured bacterium (gcode 4) TaxID=1234023 RepID=K1YIM1_9BACT|nr:MAG: hypothetical protein ACD_80C00102G0011 [uncultured bacterium (gcode 4)]